MPKCGCSVMDMPSICHGMPCAMPSTSPEARIAFYCVHNHWNSKGNHLESEVRGRNPVIALGGVIVAIVIHSVQGHRERALKILKP